MRTNTRVIFGCLTTFLFTELCLPELAQADPITVSAIGATSSVAGSNPGRAIDGNTTTYWNAGTAATPWIQIDLGQTVAIRRIRLLPRSLSSQSVNEIYVGQTDQPSTLLGTTTVPRRSPVWQEFPCSNADTKCGKVRYIRIKNTSGAKPNWREIEIKQALEYFGYFSDGTWPEMWFGADQHLYDSMQSTADAGVNLHFISLWRIDTPCVPPATPPPLPETFDAGLWQQRLQAAINVQYSHDNGAKVVLDLGDELFTYDQYGRATRRGDWQAQWSSILSFILAGSNRNYIAALYPIDEPFNHQADPVQLEQLVNTMRNGLASAGLSIPIAVTLMVTELSTIIGELANNPPTDAHPTWMFDWIGFDCYGTWQDGCAGVPIWVPPDGDGDPRTNPSMLGWLKYIHTWNLTKNATQRLTLVPPAYEGDRPGPAGCGCACPAQLQTEGTIVEAVNHWIEEAISDPRYIAVLPFRWRAMVDPRPPGCYPPSPFDKVRSRFRQVAEWIVHPGTTTGVFPIKYDVSGIYPGSEACFAFDDNPASFWNSGGFPDQGIRAYLPGNTRVSRIVLNPSSMPLTAYAQFTVWGSRPDGTPLWLGSHDGDVTDGVDIPFEGGPWDLTDVTVSSTDGDSWVAWREFQIFR